MSKNEPEPQAEYPFISHLIEMRDRLLRVVLAVLLVFLFLFTFAGDLFGLIARPMIDVLPEGSSMIATGTVDQFFTPMKLAMVMAIFLSMPYILYQAWAFIAPGLYSHERRLVMPLMISSTLLFYAGMAFAYYVVFPLLFNFMAGITIAGVEMMPDISRYLDIVIKLFFAFGLAFEVPIATILLVWTGMTTPDSLVEKRPYIIVGAFVIGMLLTPPDMISQTLLAVPMWLLFEAGVIFSRMLLRQKAEREAAEAAAEQDEYGDDDVESDHHDLSEEEMEAELDRIEAEEAALHDDTPKDT